MKKQQFLKSCLCFLLLTSTLFTFFACTSEEPRSKETKPREPINVDGTDYIFLAGEWDGYYYLGETVPFSGTFFATKGDEEKNVLLRLPSDSEWGSIYRKASLPTFDLSVDNCARLELVFGNHMETYRKKREHAACGEGVTDRGEIAEILSEIREQKSAKEAGLYKMIRNSDGYLENCYICGVVFGFFEEEPGIVLIMQVQSFNDLAYSIKLEGKEYVLPEKVLQKLQGE